jgi:hypothetical protein
MPSTLIDLWLFVRLQYILLDVNADVGKLQFSRYGFSDLASPDRFWIIFFMVAPRRIDLAMFVSATIFSIMVIRTLGSPGMLIKIFGYFALTY